jgi:hypothetical protein
MLQCSLVLISEPLPFQYKDRNGFLLWWCKIALANERVAIINILCPKVPELVHTNIQPRLHVTIEMHNGSVSNLFHADAWIIPEPKDMPRFVQRLCGRVERD